jgi:RNA polymerase sigma factor (sigma-70 family)
MTATDHDLLRQFTREQLQDAFTALVNRHMNLVYSAAFRQVRSPQLAEEVCQAVFTQLARHAAKLTPDTILTAWLYQVTRNAAIDVIRCEARRQAREQIAFQMSDMNDNPAGWTHIEPLLDEAMQSLDATDRAAILLRYFENKSLQEVGESLGTSEDAAQKRVSRAVDRLREFFSQRKLTVGASGLVALVSANAIQAAPAGLASAVATGALLGSTTISTSAAVTLTKAIAMTTLQKIIITTVVAGAIGVGVYQARVASNLREQLQTLKQQEEGQAALGTQTQNLQRERDRATNALAALATEDAVRRKSPNEVLKLRGEVGRLRQENAQIGSTNALSKATANPEARKILRDTQKFGMATIYKGFAQKMKLAPDQTDKLNDLLADHIMNDVDHVTTMLRDKPTPEQIDALFATQDAALQQQVEALLGQDGLAQYQDYTKNLLSTLTAEQFKSLLTGTDTEKEQKSNQLRVAIQSGAQAALADAGLPADYQTVPMLNFRNIVSEQAADQSLKLLDDIYQRAAGAGSAFLTAEEIAKFQEFKKAALNSSRGAITLNRTMMAPISN